MQVVRIRTSQNIDIDYEVAGLGERVLARIVDMGVFIGITYALYFICIIVFLSTFQSLQTGGSIPVALIVVGVVYAIVAAFYDLVCEVFFNGQSIGKYAIKIKVVDISGSRPTMGQFLLRWVFRLVDFGLTLGIGALISVAVSEKKQRIGDLVAGTTLVKTKLRTELEDLYFMAPDGDYEPLFVEVNNLSDNDIAVVHDVIANFKSTGNSKLVYDMAVKIKEHLGLNTPVDMNDFDFLKTVVKDYNYIISRSAI
ncbi:MAG: RDD family protein [Mucilaginibacter sp.]|uniref:RDD family protein n=1 Tax=Mucilaginibacter sp. TaxID=1882438 RepID=UPI00326795CC